MTCHHRLIVDPGHADVLRSLVSALRENYLAISALSKTCQHASWVIRRAQSLQRSFAGGKAALLGDGDRHVRREAVRALGTLGEHASPHASAMAALLGDGDEDVRRAAVEALGELGEHASPHAAAMAAMS